MAINFQQGDRVIFSVHPNSNCIVLQCNADSTYRIEIQLDHQNSLVFEFVSGEMLRQCHEEFCGDKGADESGIF